MNDNVGLYTIHNGRIMDSNAEVDVDTSAGKTAYEVIRIINGVPLFYEDHYMRMKETLRTIGADLKMTGEQMADNIKTLLKANKICMCNIMVIVSGSKPYNICKKVFLPYKGRSRCRCKNRPV